MQTKRSKDRILFVPQNYLGDPTADPPKVIVGVPEEEEVPLWAAYAAPPAAAMMARIAIVFLCPAARARLV